MPLSDSDSNNTPANLSQLYQEVQEIKQIVKKIRRAQLRSAWFGVLKIVIYLAIIGVSILAIKNYLPIGIQAITGSSQLNMQDLLATSSLQNLSPNTSLGEVLKNLQQIQNQR